MHAELDRIIGELETLRLAVYLWPARARWRLWELRRDLLALAEQVGDNPEWLGESLLLNVELLDRAEDWLREESAPGPAYREIGDTVILLRQLHDVFPRPGFEFTNEKWDVNAHACRP